MISIIRRCNVAINHYKYTPSQVNLSHLTSHPSNIISSTKNRSIAFVNCPSRQHRVSLAITSTKTALILPRTCPPRYHLSTRQFSVPAVPPPSSTPATPLTPAGDIVQQINRKSRFFRPLKLEEDLPILVDKEDGKTRPVVFLPRANHDWWKLWNVPDSVAIPRKRLGAMFFSYLLIGSLIFIVLQLPRGLLLLKDAEKKHSALSLEVKKEEEYFSYLQNTMTGEEIFRVLDGLPHKPGEVWNPDREAELERIQRRVKYPN